MPYNADGTFTPDMPSSNAPANVLAQPLDTTGADAAQAGAGGLAFINKHTAQAYRGAAPRNPLAGLPKGAAPKPGYANVDVPEFPAYLSFAAKRDGQDIASMDDATILSHAKDYADQMLPQALLASGHKVDKEYLKTLTPNFQYQTAQQLPALRAYFAANAPPPVPAAPSAGSTASDVGKELGGQALEMAGNVLAGAPRAFEAGEGGVPGTIGGDLRASIHKNVDPYLEKAANFLSSAVAGPGKNVLASESPGFQAAANEPIIKPGQNLFGDDGSINYGALNSKALSGPSLTRKVGGGATALGALLLTKNPGALATMFASGTGEQLRNEELARLNALTPEQWDAVPAYHAKILSGMDPATAKQQVTDESTAAQQQLGLTAGAAFGVIPAFKPAAGGMLAQVAKNYLTQAPIFSALAGLQAKGQAMARNEALGTNENTNAGVAEAAAGGALSALPIALAAGGHAPRAEAPASAAPRLGESAAAPAPGGAGVVDAAVRSAFEETPVPAPAQAGGPAFADPAAAKAHYDAALSAFKGSLAAEGVRGDAAAAAQPAFDAAWKQQSGFDPATLAVAPEAAPPAGAELDAAAAQAPEVPPAEQGPLDAIDLSEPTPSAVEAAQPATGPEARAGAAADELPPALTDRLATELRSSLGREPTPEEISQQGKTLLEIALGDPRVDGRIPRNALEAAVGQLAAKSKELPPAKAINALAKKLESSKELAPQVVEAKPADETEQRFNDFLDKAERRRMLEEDGQAILDDMEENNVSPQDVNKQFWTETYDKLPRDVQKRFEQQFKSLSGMEPREGQSYKDFVMEETDLPRSAGDLEGTDRGFVVLMDEANRRAARGRPKDVLAKKAEAAPQEAGAADETHAAAASEETLASRRQELLDEKPITASAEDRAKYQPLEDFYRRFSNVGDALAALSTRLKDPALSRVIKRILSNPYLRDRLGKEKLSVHNPEDKPYGQNEVGSFLRKRLVDGEEKMFKEYRFGEYNAKRGITLPGAGWAGKNLLDHGLHPVTFVHEAMHAAISHVIQGVESGAIKDVGVKQAYHELENLRQTLEKYSGATSTDKDTLASIEYAATNVHELTSVAMTDPRVQSALQRIKIGTINAWQKLMGIFNRLLGGTSEDVSTISRITDLTNRLIDYKPEGYVPPGDETHLSQRSERVEENTADRVQAAIKVKSSKEAAQEQETAQVAEGQPTRAQAFETKVFDKLKPLTHLNEKLASQGKTVAPKENMDDAIRVYQNKASRESALVSQQFVTPTINKIVELAQKAGKDPQEFLSNLSALYFGRRALEVNERGELESARLKSAAEKERQAVKTAWAEGKLPNGQYIEALKRIVNAPGARVANRTPLYKSGITDEVAHELIARAKKEGITPDVVAQFEPNRKALVEQISRNYEASGRFSASDAARRTGLGSKWYLPLKGFGEAADAGDFEGSGIGAFTREYQAAGGRSSISANPILSLLQELQRSARDVPENEFTKSVYNFAKSHGKELGMKVRTLDVESAARDAAAAGGSLSEMQRIFKNENAVVHNNGEYRYSVEFPKSMEAQLKAIKGVNETPELNGALKRIGQVTNFISRGATTFQVPFLFWNAFWRDMGYVGTQVGMDLGPAAAARYAANYWLKGGPLRGRGTYFSGLKPRNALEREAYAQSSNSSFAKSLSEMAKHGGDLSFENQLNATTDVGSLHKALEDASKPSVTPAKAAKAVTHWLDQIGTSDIMTARVAAYEAYVQEAKAKLGRAPSADELLQMQKDGALFSRRVLDYQQRSDVSQTMNVVFPFSRVVLNQTDRLLQTFKRPDGTYDGKKAALFTGLGLAAGASYYALLRQAYPDIKKEEDGTLAKNWVIPFGGKVYKIPMAYGLTRLFMTPGMMLARAGFGDTSKEDAANQVRNALQEGFTPFRPREAKHNERFSDEVFDLLQSMTPGALQPMTDLARNENSFASPISPSDEFTKGAHSDAGFRSTPDAWKWMAKELHTLTGGAVDAYPESLRYLVSAYGTGPGNALIRATAVADKSAKGGSTDAGQFPLVPSIRSRDAEFYETRMARERQEDLERKGSSATAAETTELKQLRSMASRYGREKSAVGKNSLLSAASKQQQLDAITARQKAEQASFLKAHPEH